MRSQVGQLQLGTSCDVFAMFQICQFHLGDSWYVAMASQIGRFYLSVSETLWQLSEKVLLINVPVATSSWRFNVVQDVAT